MTDHELLNEYITFSASDFREVASAVNNVFRVARVVAKDVVEATRNLVQVAITFDARRLRELSSQHQRLRDQITGEYTSELENVRNSLNGDFSLVAFIVSPGPYMAARLVNAGPGAWYNARVFLNGAGFEWEAGLPFLGPDDDVGGRSSSDEMARALTTRLQLGVPIAGDVTTGMIDQLSRAIVQRLEQKFGMANTVEGKVDVLGMILEDKTKRDSEALLDRTKTALLKQLHDAPAKLFVDHTDVEKIVRLVEAEAKSYVDIVSAPGKFLSAVAGAKTVDDITVAGRILEKTPFSLTGDMSKSRVAIDEFVKQAKALPVGSAERKRLLGKDEQGDVEAVARATATRAVLSSIVSSLLDPTGEQGKQFDAGVTAVLVDAKKSLMLGLSESELDEVAASGADGRRLSEVIEGSIKAIESLSLRRSTGKENSA